MPPEGGPANVLSPSPMIANVSGFCTPGMGCPSIELYQRIYIYISSIVGGFNPFEKHARQNGFNLPQFCGVNSLKKKKQCEKMSRTFLNSLGFPKKGPAPAVSVYPSALRGLVRRFVFYEGAILTTLRLPRHDEGLRCAENRRKRGNTPGHSHRE